MRIRFDLEGESRYRGRPVAQARAGRGYGPAVLVVTPAPGNRGPAFLDATIRPCVCAFRDPSSRIRKAPPERSVEDGRGKDSARRERPRRPIPRANAEEVARTRARADRARR